LGFLQKLLEKNKNLSSSNGINVKPLLENINSAVESGINKGESIESIERSVDKITDDFAHQLEDTLVAKLADKWVCMVCETTNTGGGDICSGCNSKAGSLKCPNCGDVLTPELEQCSCNFNWDTWEQCTVCEKWYDTKANKKCPHHN